MILEKEWVIFYLSFALMVALLLTSQTLVFYNEHISFFKSMSPEYNTLILSLLLLLIKYNEIHLFGLHFFVLCDSSETSLFVYACSHCCVILYLCICFMHLSADSSIYIWWNNSFLYLFHFTINLDDALTILFTQQSKKKKKFFYLLTLLEF